MKFEEKILLIAILIVSMSEAMLLTSFAQQEEGPYPMNASISQPICIQLSEEWKTGILFTNTTTIGVQYPITNMTTLNNATLNYIGTNFGTWYNVSACSGNTIDLGIYHCACSNLKCSGGGSCTPGSDELNVAYDAQGGVGWANGTTPTGVPNAPPNTNDYYFPGPLQYQLIGGQVTPGSTVHLRYWIDPSPDNKPSGIYNTTFKVRGVEYTDTPGSCTC